MPQLYNVESPISREQRNNINATFQDIQSRFSNLVYQISILTGGADLQEIIQRIEDTITSANNTTANTQQVLDDITIALNQLQTTINQSETATNNANQAITNLQTELTSLQNEINQLGNARTYDNSTTYERNNVVEYNGSSYMAIQRTVGNTPPTLPLARNDYWQLLAQRGIDGTGSVSSVNSFSPDINGNVELDVPTLNQFNELQLKTNNVFDNFVNVKDFGAIGDGVVDDSDAIQNALNASSVVFIPVGNYLLDKTLLLNSENKIFGVSGQTRLFIGPNFDNTNGILQNSGVNGDVDVYYDKDLVLKDLILDGSNVVGREGNFVLFAKAKNVLVENVTVMNTTQIGMAVPGCSDVYVKGCTFTNIGRPLGSLVSAPAFWADTYGDGSRPVNVNVDDCTFINNTWSGCYFMPTRGIVSNSRFVNCGESSIFSNDRANSVTYINNYIFGARKSNISASGIETEGTDVIIKGNKIYNCGDSGISITNARRVVVSDNIIKNNGVDNTINNGAAGISLYTLLQDSNTSTNIVISNNIITDDREQSSKTQMYGIQTVGNGYGFTNVSISDNILIGNGTSAVRFEPGKSGQNFITKNNVGHNSQGPYINVFQTPESTGNTTITGIGFKPSMVEFFSVENNASQSRYFQSKCTSGFSVSTSTATDGTGSAALIGSSAVAIINGAQSILTGADFVSFTEDGFILNFTSLGSRPYINYIAYP